MEKRREVEKGNLIAKKAKIKQLLQQIKFLVENATKVRKEMATDYAEMDMLRYRHEQLTEKLRKTVSVFAFIFKV